MSANQSLGECVGKQGGTWDEADHKAENHRPRCHWTCLAFMMWYSSVPIIFWDREASSQFPGRDELIQG